MKKLFYLTILFAGFLISCAGSKSLTGTNETDLYDKKWSLKRIHTDSGTVTVDTKAFLKFDSTKKSAGGNGSCNNFGSNFTVSSQGISFSNIFSTKMYCEAVQQTENLFLGQLSKATSYQVNGKKLTLYAGETLLLEFEASEMK